MEVLLLDVVPNSAGLVEADPADPGSPRSNREVIIEPRKMSVKISGKILGFLFYDKLE